jgi:hypothetical protein
VSKGSWDSIHVIEVIETSATKATYKLTTTVMLSMSVSKEEVGNTNMSGSLTRQVVPSSLPHHLYFLSVKPPAMLTSKRTLTSPTSDD